ncbi:hypothetical protein [Burkholderia pyrrocinia]|uniref:hypothetical protein n=1 Tax=Burkholderia pyrrocinia TaxID=60550 RepID=UPI000AC3D035|nr:hypothetical protein [Burkholderia pyrrocinia]
MNDALFQRVILSGQNFDKRKNLKRGTGRSITGLGEMPIESQKGRAGQSRGFSRIAGRPARIARSGFVS